jgi:hypothetical protein
VTKIHDISTEWGQALLTADAAHERPERLTLPLTVPEKTALEHAAAHEGVTPEVFLRAVWLEWCSRHWREQLRQRGRRRPGDREEP